MSLCPVCDSNEVKSEKWSRNQYRCKSCSTRLKLQYAGIQIKWLDEIAAILFVLLVITAFVKSDRFFLIWAMFSLLLPVLIGFFLGQKKSYISFEENS